MIREMVWMQSTEEYILKVCSMSQEVESSARYGENGLPI